MIFVIYKKKYNLFSYIFEGDIVELCFTTITESVIDKMYFKHDPNVL